MNDYGTWSEPTTDEPKNIKEVRTDKGITRRAFNEILTNTLKAGLVLGLGGKLSHDVLPTSAQDGGFRDGKEIGEPGDWYPDLEDWRNSFEPVTDRLIVGHRVWQLFESEVDTATYILTSDVVIDNRNMQNEGYPEEDIKYLKALRTQSTYYINRVDNDEQEGSGDYANVLRVKETEQEPEGLIILFEGSKILDLSSTIPKIADLSEDISLELIENDQNSRILERNPLLLDEWWKGRSLIEPITSYDNLTWQIKLQGQNEELGESGGDTVQIINTQIQDSNSGGALAPKLPPFFKPDWSITQITYANRHHERMSTEHIGLPVQRYQTGLNNQIVENIVFEGEYGSDVKYPRFFNVPLLHSRGLVPVIIREVSIGV